MTAPSLVGDLVDESLAHARAAECQTSPAVQAASQDEPCEDCMQDHASFDALVRPLELRVGARLNEPARTECFRAFEEHPAGVEMLVTTALERAERNPLGLFVKMIRDRDHVASVPETGPTGAWKLRVVYDVDGGEEVLDELLDDEASCHRRAAELRASLDVSEVEVFSPR